MKKDSLHEVQKIFWKNLLSTKTDRGSLSKILVGSRGRSVTGRMAIYHEGYFLRILGALKEDFGDLTRFMGENNFDKMAREYVDTHTSQHYSLRFIGSRLPGFLKKSRWHKKFPWAADLATFEWKKVDAFDGPDHAVVTREELASVSQEAWPRLRFKIIPSLTVFKTQYHVEGLDELPPEAKRAPQLTQRSSRWLKMWRKEEEIYYSLLNEPEKKMLHLAMAEEKFSVICESLCTVKNVNVEGVFEILSKWIDEKIIESLNPH